MASLFNHTTLPLWVWIVIIVVTTLVIVSTVVVVTRVMIVRRRQADFVDTFGDDDLPQRKVTVRRGRVVEHSKYLSLTGSRFGLNAFTSDDNDSSSRAGARSKSPFEWWSTIISKDHPQSRNSQLTQFSMSNDAPSIYGVPSSPRQHRFYQRRDLNYSSTSLASSSKEDSVSVTVTETTPSSPPAVVRNFSRSFVRPPPHSKFSPRQHTLSRIEEASPHTSMISTRQQSRIASLVSNKRDTKSSTSSPSPYSPSLTSSFPQPPRWSVMNASRSSSIYHEAQEQATHDLKLPPPVAYEMPRSSFGESEPRVSHATSSTSHGNMPQDSPRQLNLITALPEQPESTESNSYWETRKDLHPVRTTSKKGNVLRKKSFKKANLSTNATT